MTKYLDVLTGKLIENYEEIEHRQGDEDKDFEPSKENYKPVLPQNSGLQNDHHSEDEDAYERVIMEQNSLLTL